MRLLNSRGAKTPRRVLIPATNGFVPLRCTLVEPLCRSGLESVVHCSGGARDSGSSAPTMEDMRAGAGVAGGTFIASPIWNGYRQPGAVSAFAVENDCFVDQELSLTGQEPS